MSWFRPALRHIRPLTSARFCPRLEALEERYAPAVSSISSSFNGVPILATTKVWFNSVLKLDYTGNNPVTVFVRNASVASARFNVPVPDAVVTFSPSITSASTTFDTATNTWFTSVPSSYQGFAFLAGAILPAGLGLPGGINPVVWQGDFTTDTPGATVDWAWSAAVYTRLSNSHGALGVKPIDGAVDNPYPNADLAGTPEHYRNSNIAGATGSGFGNRTGTRSTETYVEPSPEGPSWSSLAGFVYLDENDDGLKQDTEMGIEGVEITLEGVDDRGEPVFRQVTTDATGRYSFAELRAGVYELREMQPPFYDDGQDTIGTQGGTAEDDVFRGIALDAAVDGLFNNFGERYPLS